MMSGDGFSIIPSAINGFAQEHQLNANPSSQKPNPNNPVAKKKRNLPGTPDPDAEVVALSPTTLMATNRFVCEICNKGFQRDQNLQLHRRGHNLPWKLKLRLNKEVKKKVYISPEKSCVHHDPSRALGDLTGIKKHFSRKHGEKKWKIGSAVARYCPLWAPLSALTVLFLGAQEQLPSGSPILGLLWPPTRLTSEFLQLRSQVVTHPGIAPASNSLNFGVPTTPKPVSSQKASSKFRVAQRTAQLHLARYCQFWAGPTPPSRICSWELTKQLPRVVTHPGIAPASNSLNFGVPTTPKPVSSQKASSKFPYCLSRFPH
ncbi:hypothetical protein L3X38_041229 [Prunus dulcis]|uniref:C2H2-type domain-containing protein n=1 Tax=Prunus dulcis TaxID=3755 RepID=A0AAD4UU01_PRUDU|nr:hypothetical protein L3X38_041229 [Prunus dulcis]